MQPIDEIAQPVYRSLEFSMDVVEPPGDGIEFCLRIHGEIDSFREILSQEPIRVFVRATLPRIVRIAEVDLDVGCHGNALMVSHLLAPIPGQRSVQFVRQLAGVPARVP